MGSIWYCSREDVQAALDIRESAHNYEQVDRNVASASDAIDALLVRHRHGLAPQIATRYFDWPGNVYSSPTRLWLDENELISVTTLTAGGTTLASGDYFLEPVNSGPPFRYIEVNLGSSGSFGNAGTTQRAISIVGLYGFHDEQSPAGSLVEALDSSETAVDVSDSSLVGVGSLLKVDSEYMVVTDKSPLDTGQNIGVSLTSVKNNNTVAVSDGTQFHRNEIILVDSERMKITDITGNNLTVIRAYDGTVLAAHTAPADIYALRTLTVERGARGSTAAAHLTSTAVTKWKVPGIARELAIAEAVTGLQQESSGYGRRVYSDEAERDSAGTEVFSGRGLSDIRKSCRLALGRNFRKRAV